MKVIANNLAVLICLLLPAAPVSAWQWSDLWHTADQQGAKLLQQGKSTEAAQTFKNAHWQAVAQYRAGDYAKAFQQFSNNKTSDDQYNAGNSAAFQGHYKEAIAAYDKAIALNANNTDAVNNREIVKKLQAKQQEQQKNNPDDKKSKDDKNQQASSQQNKDQQKSAAQDNKDQAQKDQNQSSPKDPSAKNKDEQNDQQKKDQQAQANQDKQLGNQQKNDKKSTGQPDNSNPMNEALATNQMQNQDEDKKQLLRRLADDPGGLLRQKFIRDYYRRHPASEYLQPGDDN